MNVKRTSLLGLLGLSLLASGCLVEVRTVSDPGPEMRRARAEVDEIARHPGPAKSVHVLVYDADERKLVKVCRPACQCQAPCLTPTASIDVPAPVVVDQPLAPVPVADAR